MENTSEGLLETWRNIQFVQIVLGLMMPNNPDLKMFVQHQKAPFYWDAFIRVGYNLPTVVFELDPR